MDDCEHLTIEELKRQDAEKRKVNSKKNLNNDQRSIKRFSNLIYRENDIQLKNNNENDLKLHLFDNNTNHKDISIKLNCNPSIFTKKVEIILSENKKLKKKHK